YDFYRFSAEDKAENINILLEPDRLRNENDLTLQASELINYEETTASNDYWLNYSFQDLIIPVCVDYLVPYMPGLGYFRHYTVDLNPEQAIDYYTFFPEKTSEEPSHILSAGADCIGFAQRAAGYDSGRS
nr:hypothetical protein [Spirochaetaceae bacterium]